MPGNNGEKAHLILMTLATGAKTSPNDAIRSALNDANKNSSCGWFINDDTEIMCRTWPILPDDYPVPIDEIYLTMALMNNAWNNLYPKIKGNLR
jgi:hypothetical protein